jgi:hypothetical protein
MKDVINILNNVTLDRVNTLNFVSSLNIEMLLKVI